MARHRSLSGPTVTLFVGTGGGECAASEDGFTGLGLGLVRGTKTAATAGAKEFQHTT